MTKAIGGLSLGLSFVLALQVAYAQPAPPDVPEDVVPQTPQTGEKADTTETLQKGGDQRPWAAGVAPDAQKAALKKFREANELLNDGLFARATEIYKEALRSWKHPAIHYNLALALMNVDQPIEAYENLEQAIVFGVAPLEKDKFDHAKEYMLLLAKQIASIEVSCDKPGAKVLVDGKEAFVAPGKYKARVRIGKHTFVAEKQGYTTRINAPFIGPGEKFRIELKLYTAEELTRYTRRWEATWLPYAAIGAGFAFGVVGIGLELSAKSSYRAYDERVAACNQNNMGCPTTAELTDIRDSGRTKELLGYVSYGLAGTAVTAAIVLSVLNRPKAYQIRPEDLQEEQTQKISITPVVAPNMAGAIVHGKF